MIGHMNRGFRQLDLLNDFEVVGGSQSPSLYVAVFDLLVNGFVDSLWR